MKIASANLQLASHASLQRHEVSSGCRCGSASVPGKGGTAGSGSR
jgi:hypothetical protein